MVLCCCAFVCVRVCVLRGFSYSLCMQIKRLALSRGQKLQFFLV